LQVVPEIDREKEETEMTLSRRSLFGLALLPVMPMPTLAKRSFLAPGHLAADAALLVTDMAGGPIISPTAFNQLCRGYAQTLVRWRILSDSNRPEKPAGAENGSGW
jgi:hypothetical protein